MKIAIPVDDKSLNSNVCVSFGRTPYFLVYDTNAKDAEFLNNSAAASQGGAGIKASQTLADKKADVVITPRCGENAAEVLTGADIKIYKSIFGSAQKNIDEFLKGNLSVLTEIHAGFHKHGSN
jgi:predicted Fe-Mo cluster-binding NifX family protein